MKNVTKCRLCGTSLTHTFVDLGMTPLANSFLEARQLDSMEPFYPLHVYVCESCLLVQLNEYRSSEAIFSDYLYFSSYSTTWLNHARVYTREMTERFGLGSQSRVVEVASNDGYLLQYFLEQGVSVLGIEPAANVAQAAEKRGVPTRVAFFNEQTAQTLRAEGIGADLVVNNNVLAHVPDLHGFIAGLKILLNDDGVITVEFPHILELIRCNQFDTIYHEHFSYFSLHVIQKAFLDHGLTIFDVEQIPTHGGSLRIFASHSRSLRHVEQPGVERIRRFEAEALLDRVEGYETFASRAVNVKCSLLDFLIDVRRKGKTIVGYGAPAKGNTLLNYAGVGPELLPYTVDRNPHKQNRFLPGVHIPIYEPDAIHETRPNYVLILPWNLREEIQAQLRAVREWGGQFVTAIPGLEVF
jgi:SAM-dependent methyltransferase